MRQVVLVNASTLATDFDIATWMAAYQEDISLYGMFWNIGPVDIRQLPKGNPLPAGWEQIVFLDDADVASALGYHDRTAEGLPMGKVFVRTTQQDGQTVSRVGSHELWEMLVDPDLNRYSDVIDGKQYAVEVGDLLSLDSQGRTASNGTLLSGIALPAAYYPSGKYGLRYDIGGVLTAPLPDVQPAEGAYLMWKGGSGWAGQCLAAHGDHFLAMQPKRGSRRHRRIVGAAGWKNSTVAVA